MVYILHIGIELNHTIINVQNKQASANFWAEILGLPAPVQVGYFSVLRTSNAVSLDFIDSNDKIELQHYAFKVSEKEFDEIFERIKSRGLAYWADPAKKIEYQIYSHNYGRGVYFTDTTGHLLEVLTWI